MKRTVCVLGCVVLLFIGCGKGQRASIMGSVNFFWYSDSVDSLAKECFFEGYKYNGFKILPIITINKDTLPLDYYSYDPTGFLYESEIANLNNGDPCELNVDYGEGKGEAKDTMPEEFTITNPDTSTILRKGNSLNITWESSGGANWYWLDVYIWYYYIDNNGAWREFEYGLDTVIEGTSYTIGANTLWPSDVDSVVYGYGDVYVEAVCGPKIEPGAKGNIKGDAVGFFWCVYDAKPVWFGIERLAQKPKKDHQTEIRKRHLEAMRNFAQENE